jgi:exopolysaccharide biosynthesis polyprenyl glycosylphosphotransferase
LSEEASELMQGSENEPIQGDGSVAQSPAHANGNGNGNVHVARNGNGYAGEDGTVRPAELLLTAMSAVDQTAYPTLAEPGAATLAEPPHPERAAVRELLSRVRDLDAGPVRGPLLRYAAILAPIAVVLVSTVPDLTALRFFGLLALLAGVWFTVQHATTVSARLSPFAVGVWAPTLAGAINGAIVTAAICLMLPRLGVRYPQILLMLAGVFVLSCLVEALMLRLGRRRRLLLVGAPEGAIELVRDLAANPHLPFEWVGVVTEELPRDTILPVPVLGTLADLPRIVPSSRPDLVVVADLAQRDQALGHLLGMADVGFRIVGLPEIYEYALGRVPVRHLPHAWFMSLLHLYQRPPSRLLARGIDLTVATVGMVVCAPVFALIAAIVRCSSRGPVFFRQKRVGAGGKLFELVKFRTMVDGAENGRAVWAMERDDRITGVGRFLRATRLDELPQLWNVLRNEMSVIGPRPERPEFLELLEREVPFWARRLLIKPGITGWAQVQSGYAADTVGAAEKLSYDLYYLKHRSMLLDFAIVAKTAAIVVSRAGAR